MLNLRVVLLLVFTILTERILVEAATTPTKVVVAYASISPRVAPLWAWRFPLVGEGGAGVESDNRQHHVTALVDPAGRSLCDVILRRSERRAR